MSLTPSRRMSLRRKRSSRNTDGADSPIRKKVSPLPHEAAGKESKADASQVLNNRVKTKLLATSKASLSTPKACKKQEPNNVDVDDTKTRETDDYQPLHQHSPDTPFMSSQLCGTQDCEVVWDCNSPGYSKDDLKRMPGGDQCDSTLSTSPNSYILPVPHRTLFPKARARQNSSSAKNTTAQLDELLLQLSSRGQSIVEDKRPANCSPPLRPTQTWIKPENSPRCEEDFDIIDPPAALCGDSSQTFDVCDDGEGRARVQEKRDLAVTPDSENSLWDDDLNMGICDIDGDDDIAQTEGCVDGTKERGDSVKETEKEKGKCSIISSKDLSNASTDFFDDDLFNDSVIRSTQAMEEALINRECKSLISSVKSEEPNLGANGKWNRVNSGQRKTTFDPSEDEGVVLVNQRTVSSENQQDVVDKRNSYNQNQYIKSNNGFAVQHSKVPCTVSVKSGPENRLGRENDEEIRSIQNVESDNSNRSQPKPCDRFGGDSQAVGKNKNYAGIGSSPVIGRQRDSPENRSNVPQKQIRSNYRVDGGGMRATRMASPQKSLSTKPLYPVNNVAKVVNVSNSKNFYSLKNDERTSRQNTIRHAREGRQLNTKIPHVSENVVCEAQNTEVPKIFKKIQSSTEHSRKSLFRSDNGSNSTVGRGQGKASLTRSYSDDSGHGKTSTLSTSLRKVCSSVEGEMSKEFEDDDIFFDSILMDFPEDEENLAENRTSETELKDLMCRKSAMLGTTINESLTHKTKDKLCGTELGRKECSGIVSEVSDFDKKNNTKIPDCTAKPAVKDKDKWEQTKTSVSSSLSRRTVPNGGTEFRLHRDSGDAFRECYDGMSGVQSRATSYGSSSVKAVEEDPPEEFFVTGEHQSNDTLDDDFFEDDVLSVVEEVESLYGSQCSGPSTSQTLRCTQDEIARKKEAAQRLRIEKQKQRHLQ